ncbi:hypothetical protein BWR60_21720 [Inquilinus limosus]|uniref:O-antigen ligase-related domain-containing protein n=2 Tax=Inquilinus limosus TaxID=171674 RepID=A0A211ZIB2_9PROT|nr:hypothetical protein BWR60_21720 [Inquilinus limosus]
MGRVDLAMFRAVVAMLFVAVVLGIGSSLAVTAVQILLLLALLAFILKDAIARRFDVDPTFGALGLILLVVGSTIVAIFVSYSDVTQSLSFQIRYSLNFLSTIAVIWILYYSIVNELISPQLVLRFSIYAYVIYGLAKIVLNVFIIVQLLRQDALRSFILSNLNVSFLTTGIFFGLIRVNFPPDFGLPIVTFAALLSKRLGVSFFPSARFFYIFILLTAILIAYSRYLWIVAFFATFFAAVVMGRKQLAVFIMLTLAIGGLALTVEEVRDAIEYRFSSVGVDSSDDIRDTQERALVDSIETQPFFGKGLATYVPYQLLRRGTIGTASPYSYELQIVATVMQFGVIGVIPIMLLMCSFVYTIRTRNFLIYSVVCVMYIFWILAGFTNPSLIGRAAGLVFVMYVCVGLLSQRLEPGRRAADMAVDKDGR